MPLQVTCSCGQKLKAGDNLAGKTVKCPKCKQPLKIPALSPAPEIDLGSGSLLSSGLDDLFSQEMAPSGMGQPAGFSNPAQFGRTLPTSYSQGSDGFPKWMLFAGGGITLVLLLGLGIAMVVTSLTAGKKPEAIVQAEGSNSDEKQLAPDEVRDTDVASAFQEQAREKKNEPAISVQRSEPAKSDSSPNVVDETEVSEENAIESTAADELPSESGAIEELSAEEISEEIDDALLQEIRDRIKNEAPGVPPPLNIDAEIEAGIRKTFDSLMEAYRREVRDLFTPLVDEQRFVETVFKEEFVKGLSEEDKQRLRKIILDEHSFVAALSQNRAGLKFNSYEIRSAEASPNKKTVAVVVRAMNPDMHESVKFRYWLCHHSTGWKIFDLEILANAARLSRTLTYRSGTRQQLQPFIQEMTFLQQAVDAYRTGDHDRLGKTLDRMDSMTLTKNSRFALHYLRAYWCFDERDFERALREAELAHAVAPRSPELFLVRAIAHNGLGNYGTAIPLANTYERRLGRDENYWHTIGMTLSGLNNPEDAIAAWERGLEYNPQFHGLLHRLAIAYSPDNLDKMVPHIHKDKLKDDAFNRLLASLEADELMETRDFLIEAREKQ